MTRANHTESVRMSPRIVVLMSAMLVMTTAHATPGAAAPAAGAVAAPDSFFGELLAILLPLVLIIAGLLVLLRLVRRRFGLSSGAAPLSVVQILPVGPRERLVLVKSNTGRAFAIGVGAQTVTYITDIELTEANPAAAAEPASPPADPSNIDADG